jgi:hypothetical protein
MLRLAAITVLASAMAFGQLLWPGFKVPVCTGFPHARSPVLVVHGSSMHVRMPAKQVKR